MLIKRKKLARKNGVDDSEVKNILLKNLKHDKREISFASPDEIEDSLDLLYQDYSDTPVMPKAETRPAISKEEIEQQAHDLIEERVNELYAQYQEEINTKRIQSENEISQMMEDARKNAEREAEAIISETGSKAEKHHREMEEEALALEKEKAKFNETIILEKQKAYDEGMEHAEAHINELMVILSSFNRIKEEIIEEVKPQIVSIALDVAKRVLDYEVANNPDLIEEQVTKSISRLINTKGVMQIYLNPEDIRHADYLDTVLSKMLDPSVRLIFVKDEEVDKGSCMINTQGGRLDAKFSTKLELIKVSFEKYLGHKIDEIGNLYEELEIEPEHNFEDLDMSNKKIIKPNKRKGHVAEPSDDDLELLENDPDALIDLDMDDDLDALLQDVLLDDDEPPKSKSKAIKAEKLKKDSFKLEHDDSTDIGANDFSNSDDLDLDAEMSIDTDDDEPEMEVFDEFAGDDEARGDSNFDDSNMDDRFPEY